MTMVLEGKEGSRQPLLGCHGQSCFFLGASSHFSFPPLSMLYEGCTPLPPTQPELDGTIGIGI
jgi:hypothetical protein